MTVYTLHGKAFSIVLNVHTGKNIKSYWEWRVIKQLHNQTGFHCLGTGQIFHSLLIWGGGFSFLEEFTTQSWKNQIETK